VSGAAGTRRAAPVAGAAAIVIALDQLTKHWALSALAGGPIDLVWTLRLRLVFNPGAAFGIGGSVAPFIPLAAVVVIVLLLRTGRLVEGRPGLVGIGLVLGGAVGNLIDRALRDGSGFMGGRVVDFVDLQWWPVFNVADVAIVTGALLLVLSAGTGDGERDGEPAGTADADADADADAGETAGEAP
jgi:signal peptidase II